MPHRAHVTPARGEADLDLPEPRRILQDEGLLRCLNIACNVLKDQVLRQRILAIRRVYRRRKATLAIHRGK